MKILIMLGAVVVAASSVVTANEALAATTAPAPSPPQAAPAPPSPPTPDGTAGDAKQAAIEAELEAARQKLEADAKEVARLSMQIGKPLFERYRTNFEGSPHAIIGVEIATENNPAGARVLDVSPGSPADEAGMRAGDIIVSVNGTEAKGQEAGRRVVRAIHDSPPNTKLSLRVLRDGKSKDLVVVGRPIGNQFYFQAPRIHTEVQAQPMIPDLGAPPVFSYRELGIPSLSNMQLATLTPGLGHYFGTEKGVLVVRAPTNSNFKLEDGDVILSIDGREPTSGAHATRILASYQAGEKVTLHIMREHKTLNLEAKLPEDVRGARQVQPRPLEARPE